MYAPKSPLRKTPSYTGAPRAYQAQGRGNAADSSVNPIPIMVGQIRTAADEYSSSPSHADELSRYLAKLSVFYFTPKLPESVGYTDILVYIVYNTIGLSEFCFHSQDIASLVDIVGSLGCLPLTLVDISNIARFISRSSRTDLPNLAMFKAAGMENIFEILLSDLCRALQSENVAETHEHVCDILLGLSCILQYSGTSSWLAQYRQYTLRALLLLHSFTLGLPQLREANHQVTQLKLQASTIEALGYAYCVTLENKSTIAANTDSAHVTQSPLIAQLRTIFPGVGGSESKLSAQVLELLVASIHTSQLYIKALPTTASSNSLLSETPSATVSNTTLNPTVIYHTTTAQLTLLIASLRAAHLVFDTAHSAAKISAKKSGTKAVSALVLRLNQRNSLLTSAESLLKDSVGLLNKRLALVAENCAQINTDTPVSTTSSDTNSSTSSNITNPVTTIPTVKTSAFAKAAYRPPSQRTAAPQGITTKPSFTENSSSLPTPPGFQTTNSTANAGINNNTASTISGGNGTASTGATATAKDLQVLRDKVTQMGLAFVGSLAAHDPGIFTCLLFYFCASNSFHIRCCAV